MNTVREVLQISNLVAMIHLMSVAKKRILRKAKSVLLRRTRLAFVLANTMAIILANIGYRPKICRESGHPQTEYLERIMNPMRKILFALVTLTITTAPLYAQNATKLRVIAAPGVTKAQPKNWHNSLGVSGKELVLHCPKCAPIQTVDIAEKDIAALRYGQNAYHHWVAGIVSGVFSLGVGLIVGLMPHHQHFFSVDTKEGKVLAIQAHKRDYRQIAGMLENFTGLPIFVTAKDAHYLNGFNIKIENTPEK